MSEHQCSYCDKTYKSRSGVWKHEQKCLHKPTEEEPQETVYETKYDAEQSPVEDTSVAISESPPSSHEHDEEVSDEAGDTTFTWQNFEMGDTNDDTDVIPTPLKVVAAQKPPKNPKKMSAKEKEALKDTNMALLKMGLTGADALMTQYGKKVCDDKEFKVRHSDKDKNLVATAQWEWMSENDIILSAHISKGLIASALTAHYIGAPIMRIQKNAKTPLSFAGGRIGGFFRKLPLIGRLFGRKKKKTAQHAIVVEDGEY